MATIREEFEKFINQGNLIQLAIAFVMGVAFAAVVTALVSDIFTPLIGAVIHVDFAAWTFTINGSTIMQGAFLNSLISFITIAVVVFFVIALPYQRHLDAVAAKAAAAPPTTRPCPECLSQIPLAATRCAFCAITVTPAPAPVAAPAGPVKKRRWAV
jgi:large conductance mechanosensitive channel